MNNYEIINKTDYKIDMDTLKKTLDIALKEEKVENAYFNVIFIKNEDIHKINLEYRNIDRETDVISFALEDENTYPDLGIRVLGDIYISVDRIVSQAHDYGHSEVRETCFLAVHGLLHLLGYDHTKSELDEKIMFDKQDIILKEAGVLR